MATKSNQGFLKSLNLLETPNDTTAINNLAGAGIAGCRTAIAGVADHAVAGPAAAALQEAR